MTIQTSSGTTRKGGTVLTRTEEDEDSQKCPQIVDPVGVAKDKKKECLAFLPSSDNVFLIASYTMVLVELAAALFTLSVIHLKLKDSLVHKVTLGYYILYSQLTIILVANSINSLRGYAEEKAENKISSKQYTIKCVQDSATVISSCMWIALGVASVVMELGYTPECLRLFALVLSVAAPMLGMFSAFTRAYDVIYSSKIESAMLKEAEERAAAAGDVSASQKSDSAAVASRRTKEGASMWVRSGLYLIISVFEAVHCMCHIYEAYLLVGETNKLFSITDQVLLGTQASLALLFIVFCAAEHVLEKNKKGCELPASANDNASQAVASVQSSPRPSTVLSASCYGSPSTNEAAVLTKHTLSVQGVASDLANAVGYYNGCSQSV